MLTHHPLLSYLDSAVKFAYTLYSALEKYARTRDEIHFRKRRAAQLIKRRWCESQFGLHTVLTRSCW